MTSFNDILTGLLEKNIRYIDEDKKLIRTEIINDALKIDKELITLLLSNKEVKNKFFTEIEKHWIFEINKFIEYIQDKNFLNDSYTKYKNKIGLTIDGKYFNERREVSLAFPFKDCILEGGQTKEEDKSKEIFFNEILAQDEIDRLLEPKVLVNFKRYTATGEKKIDEFKRDNNGLIKENLIIKGNNLLALYSIKKQFQGKIKLIYIDPPYNTGNDSFGYNDNFNHSTWLTFMKNRLEVSKDLLKEDGFLFISIDDIESAYLKILLDEVFGRENFLANIAYERSGVSGLGQGGQFLVNNSESILCFAKNKSKIKVINTEGNTLFTDKDMKRYNKIFLSFGKRKEIGRFKAPSTNEDVIIYKHVGYEIKTISLSSFEKRKDEIMKEYIKNFYNIFRNTIVQEENKFQTKIMNMCKDGLYSADYLVSRGKREGQKITSYYLNGQVFAWLKDTAKINKNSIYKTNKLSTFWSHSSIPKADLSNEGGVELRRGKKPEALIKQILELGTETEDIILDYHLGSGTTGAVAHKMGRQYIGIEQLNYEENGSVTRLKNVIGIEKSKGKLSPIIENYDETGISKSVNWKGGGDFIYCELAKYNEEFIEKINKAKAINELLKIWQDMKDKSFINYNIDLKKVDETIEDFKKLSLNKQKEALILMLNKNQLYVNLSEIEDTYFKISKEDKELNKKFYALK